ncbi:MAG: type VI secretion protein, partial [Actinomycetota bacterium]|nr:type VI secretion protein [Actinomycetota bacterium]
MPTPQPIPPPSEPSGPLARYLAHPGATTSRLLHQIGHVLAHLAVTLELAIAGVALAALVALSVARRVQARRMTEGTRLVTVRTPPEVDPQGAATLWTNLVALLRPAWRRLLGGQPHLGFELTATDGGLTVALWVPGPVPPGLVERAVEAAWPGA